MKLVFMGTPSFAVPSLAALLEARHEVAAVFCQPDRPIGRSRRLQPPPVKQFALEHGISVEQPPKLRDPGVFDRLSAIDPEVIVVAAYGKILPRAILELAVRGAINVHGSLLPRWRGAAPIQRAILAGDDETGVTIMQMNEKMDEGDILYQCGFEIRPTDTTPTLSERMAEIGATALVETLSRLERAEIIPEPQDEALATMAPMIRKEEGEIDWTRSSVEIERAVRAFTPWPSTYTRCGRQLLKILAAEALPDAEGEPGRVLRADSGTVEVGTGEGRLRIVRLQLEGKRPQSAGEAVRGRLVSAGDALGSREQS